MAGSSPGAAGGPNPSSRRAAGDVSRRAAPFCFLRMWYWLPRFRKSFTTVRFGNRGTGYHGSSGRPSRRFGPLPGRVAPPCRRRPGGVDRWKRSNGSAGLAGRALFPVALGEPGPVRSLTELDELPGAGIHTVEARGSLVGRLGYLPDEPASLEPSQRGSDGLRGHVGR